MSFNQCGETHTFREREEKKQKEKRRRRGWVNTKKRKSLLRRMQKRLVKHVVIEQNVKDQEKYPTSQDMNAIPVAGTDTD